jgi:hypothetical protein
MRPVPESTQRFALDLHLLADGASTSASPPVTVIVSSAP